MSRLYIIGLLVLFSAQLFSQQELKQYLEFAKEKYDQGDYVYALKYYDKAMKIDSNSINTLWNYAQTLRAYKSYERAAYYYGEVYDREKGQLYPQSLLYYGLMLKQCGRYDLALKTFKLAKKKYRKDRRGYLYMKTRNEVQSCIWARANQGDSSDLIFEQLPSIINSVDSEFGHRLNGGKLYLSSLRPDSSGLNEVIYDTAYQTHLYTASIKEDTLFENPERINELFWSNYSTGNGTFSLDGKRFYFSFCKGEKASYSCKILVAYLENNRFVEVDTLGPIINVPGANTTMPFIGEWEGKEVLFYASNREGGDGGMDIWYSFIKNGNQFGRPINVKRLNSMDNELSPYWDAATTTLYFSSSWHNGFGGYDVLKSKYNNAFESPENLGEPFNSPANDLYYFKTSSGDTSFISSNRLGSNYSKNPTCCSDIYMLRKPRDPQLPSVEESLEDLNKRLPVTLYFHNDIPNPRSTDTISTANYLETYKDYIAMIEKYKDEYSKGLKGEESFAAREDIDDFFLEYVQQGVADLEQFTVLLLEELKRGRQIQLTVKGFASPLAKTDYNVNLTKRRIASLVNYLRSYEGGVFNSYLDGKADNGGKLAVVQVPFGEYEANQFTSDNPNDVKNSVYSRAAAIERKIELQSVTVLKEEDATTNVLSAVQQLFDAGERKEGDLIERTFTIINNGDQTIRLDSIRIPCDCIKVLKTKKELNPGERGEVVMRFDTAGYSGHEVKSVYVKYVGSDQELRLVITAEIVE
jgi:tetratricopeptide (TPR) repeat protein